MELWAALRIVHDQVAAVIDAGDCDHRRWSPRRTKRRPGGVYSLVSSVGFVAGERIDRRLRSSSPSAVAATN